MPARRKRAPIIVATIVLSSVALLSACSSSGSGSTSGGSSATAASGAAINVGSGSLHPQKMKNIALILNDNLSATYSVALVNAAMATAKKDGVGLNLLYDNLSAPTELTNYESVLSSGKYQGVIVQPLTGQLCQPVASDAISHNIAFVAIVSPLCSDTAKPGSDPWAPGTISFVGGMNNLSHTVSLMKSAASNTPGPQKVLLVVGTQTLPDTVSFLAGYKQYVQTNPQWTTAGTVYTDFTSPDALSQTENFLQGHKGVTMIFTSYAGITEGVVQAIQAQKLQGKIAVYDQTGGNAEDFTLVKNGQLTGTLPSYPASIGSAAVQALVDAGNGTTPERFIDNDGNPQAVSGAITKSTIGSNTAQYK
ncbi:MAG: sugar ABC transporter substrate-binding protein [Streptosporangiaceae bacterium]